MHEKESRFSDPITDVFVEDEYFNFSVNYVTWKFPLRYRTKDELLYEGFIIRCGKLR